MAGQSPYLLARALESAGDVPRLASVGALDPVMGREGRQVAHGPGGRAAPPGSGKLNARAVADVLASYGLDPAEELAKIMTTVEPVLDRAGQPVTGPDGAPLMRPAIDAELRAKLAVSLLEYTRPKLKAIEVTVKEPELSDEQIDRRLQALLTRAADVTQK